MKKVLIIGNYPPLRQESMARFARSFYQGVSNQEDIEATLWLQPELAHKLAPILGQKSSKWLGYIDLYLVAPIALAIRRFVRPADRYHICDHSDSPLTLVLPSDKTSITCHDVIAIESAFGASEHGVSPSALGKWQQRYIRHFLVKAGTVVSVSDYTRQQLSKVAKQTNLKAGNTRTVIYNKFTANFKPHAWQDQFEAQYGLVPGKYLLHLGSGHPRKNRVLIIELLDQLSANFSEFKICLAGGPPEPHEIAVINARSFESKVVWTGSIDHDGAASLYTNCFAFVFPSLSEGFGLPIAEAQACGAPVVASFRPPMPEVAGDGALYADPLSVESFAAAIERLNDTSLRNSLIDKGFRNSARYQPGNVDQQYAQLLAD